ncbi:DNA cytosine methyltransferase [Anaerococcus vaginalis]
MNGKTIRLHSREFTRLMMFPDSHKLNPNKNQSYKQLGN